jgi:hypothetical protein
MPIRYEVTPDGVIVSLDINNNNNNNKEGVLSSYCTRDNIFINFIF